MEGCSYEVAAAIREGIVDQANYLGTLAMAIFGGMVALLLQFKLICANAPPVFWLPAFWVAIVFAVPTIALVFVITGMMIELTPVLHAFPFDMTREFANQKFDNTKILTLRWFSRIQLGTFLLLLAVGGAFVLRNIIPNPNVHGPVPAHPEGMK